MTAAWSARARSGRVIQRFVSHSNAMASITDAAVMAIQLRSSLCAAESAGVRAR